jgi:predicted secreted hydrolase
MSDRFPITRRAFAAAAVALGVDIGFGRGGKTAHAQGFAGLGGDGQGFAPVVPGRVFSFPADHGPHPDFRIEWWYVTANLVDATGAALGIQWTLFRQAMRPGVQQQGWASQQIWMGHAAVTTADVHHFSETFARGGVGQAGAEATPFHAWIDSWDMRGLAPMRDIDIAPLELNASGADFSYALRLDANSSVVLEGDAGYSRKSEREQASYYYSQPFFKVSGRVAIDGKAVDVTGQAWMDREWSSQPLAPDQNGWDWFALHLNSGDRLMLYRMRQTDGRPYSTGNWITPDGKTDQISASDIRMTPMAFTQIESRKLPTAWRIELPARDVRIETKPLNPLSWMGTGVSYWEGPIHFGGSHSGTGYLEMTGY